MERRDTLKSAICHCRKFLDDRSFEKEAVIFLLPQVGDYKGATAFIWDFENDRAVYDIVYCSKKRLKVMFAKALRYQSNSHGLTVTASSTQ